MKIPSKQEDTSTKFSSQIFFGFLKYHKYKFYDIVIFKKKKKLYYNVGYDIHMESADTDSHGT